MKSQRKQLEAELRKQVNRLLATLVSQQRQVSKSVKLSAYQVSATLFFSFHFHNETFFLECETGLMQNAAFRVRVLPLVSFR